MSALGPDMSDIALRRFDVGETVQRCVGQPRARASAASARSGLTAWGYPTRFNIGRSAMLSP